MAGKKKTAKKKPTGRKPGRPTRYTPALGQRIAERMASGESVRSVARDPKMPAAATIFAWAVDPKHPFSEHYDRARRIKVETLVDDLTDIADDGSNDYMEREHGVVQNPEAIARSRLRVDTRKWFASKVAPKLYGDKLGLTGSDGEGPVQIILNESGKGSRAD